MTTKPSADELMAKHLEAKAALASAPAEDWMKRALDLIETQSFKAVVSELETISEVLPEGGSATAVLRQLAQAAKVAPQVLVATLKQA